MFANSDASRSFMSLTVDEIRWLNASNAFGVDDGDSIHSVPASDLVKPQSPRGSRPRYDSRRRSMLLDDFFGNNTPRDRTKFGFGEADESLLTEKELPSLPQRPKEWLYRRPRSPSSLSRSPSSLSGSPCLSRAPSSGSRSVTPTPTRIRPSTAGHRPHNPSPGVTEMNQSPFWTTVVPPQRSPSIRIGTPTSRSSRSPSRSSPNLLDFRGSPRSKRIGERPRPLPIQRERSGSEASSISTSSTGSLPATPPSPGSIYSQHSFTYPHPDTRSTTPSKSILTLTPKRSASISTKHSSASKSVKFDEVPAIGYADDRFDFGDGMVRGEEWDSNGDSTSIDMDGIGVQEGKGAGKALKRLLTIGSRHKTKPRPEISGPYALAPSSPGSASQSSLRLPAFKPSASASSSFISQGDVTTIPSSPNGAAADADRYKPKKSSSLIGPGDIGVIPYHGRFLSNKFYTPPARPKTPKAASVTGPGDLGVLASEPALHALPSMESFRSTKSVRDWGWLGRIGIRRMN
ncbi:hypothetical protein FB45DRAFT_536608 [Roridomyces roridus]|uniref:Uncharacterized protein n=1 Tax=Roridomyces roridus TaxID=1738132 RepID=A0AAD7BTI8_9AGAR|nr:hypothetical protein FB45DRAFT_536608 [Roridomyces roridus]